MGFIIGEFANPATWRGVRGLMINTNVPTPITIFGLHNTEYPAGAYYLQTVAGNGFLRVAHQVGGTELHYTQNTPPANDFLRFEYFADPDPANLVGATVTTSTSTFAIVAGHFTGGAAAGVGGTTPVLTVANFANLS